MNKDWMRLPRYSQTYVDGVDSFIKFAFEKVGGRSDEILCPCKNCVHGKHKDKKTMRDHLIADGFVNGYVKWIYHGEDSHEEEDEDIEVNEQVADDPDFEPNRMPEMVNDIFRDQIEDPGVEAEKFRKYMMDANEPLYQGSNESVLSFMVWLFSHKCTNRWSDISVDGLLRKLKSVVPAFAKLPNNFYETKKMVGDLGFNYEKIDACPNDCILYWKENSGLRSCPTCKVSRWKTDRINDVDIEEDTPSKANKVAAKQLRYMPLIPRLKRLFMSTESAKNMVWHHEKRRKDGVNRHPADSNAWKHLDRMNPMFAKEFRNVRLALSSDGMNPFTHGAPYSIWPVVLVVYNLPTWECMKHYNFITPLIIPGPNSPGNNIDVYLRPLVEELKTLWNTGVETYDAATTEKFTMRAALLWTISDFPALASLFGWMTKGYLACPTCQSDTRSQRIRGKVCYIGHRCFLEPNHKYRSDTRRFNGKTDYTDPPVAPTGFDMFEKVVDINITFGRTKDSQKTIPKDPNHNYRKKSIFFELPYWKTLLIRHNLDIMHIEKNVCDSLIGTLLGIQGKTKDGLNARLDMMDMGIRKELHPKPLDSNNSKYELPAACHTMSKKEKEGFLAVLKNVKVPDGYASNISRCVDVKACKISGLKSHDCHILLQQLLPVAIRGTNLPENVCSSIIEFCKYFRELRSHNCREEDYERLNKKIPLILSNIEMAFPPALFDIMMHLPVHLAEEAKIAGNPRFREMWRFEGYMKKLKGYIRNRTYPEGSIAEGIIAEECLTFCSRYLKEVDASWNRAGRNEDGYQQEDSSISVFRNVGRILGSQKPVVADVKDVEMAHAYVLFNCEEVEKYLSIWQAAYTMRRRRNKQLQRDIDNARRREFPSWFKDHIKKEKDVSDELKALAFGPNTIVNQSDGYLVNGYRFHTDRRCRNRRSQNSGVFVVATTCGYASAKDKNPREEEVEYFGVLEDVIQLDYYGAGKVVLFKCKWYDVLSRDRGIKSDVYGFTLVNSKRFAYAQDPFVMPSQAQQIFYVDDQRDLDWRVVIRTRPRDICEDAEANSDDEGLVVPIVDSQAEVTDFSSEDTSWTRNTIDAEVVDTLQKNQRKRKKGDKEKSKQVRKRTTDETIDDVEDEGEAMEVDEIEAEQEDEEEDNGDTTTDIDVEDNDD